MNGKNQKISVITVCYNAVDSIEETIKSVINQTYDNIEYIIIDGGSTDGTIDIIKRYSSHINYWISERDNGIYDAMNKGIAIASGSYMYFLNAGDTFYNEFVVDKLFKDKNSLCVVYGNVIRSNNRVIYGGKFSRFRLSYENICHQSIFYPAKVLKNFQFDTTFKILSDWALNMKLWKKYTFHFIDTIIANYEGGGVSEFKMDPSFNRLHRYLIWKNLGIDVYIFNIGYSLIQKIKEVFISQCGTNSIN